MSERLISLGQFSDKVGGLLYKQIFGIINKMIKSTKVLPKKIFWDVDASMLDIKRHRVFIIERALEHGNEKVIRWLFKMFSQKEIAAVVKSSRRLSPKSRNFWCLKLGLWQPKKQLTKQHGTIWRF